MSYEARIRKTGDEMYYALIVRLEKGQPEAVINTYKGRSFCTLKAAQKSTDKYLRGIF